MCVLHVGVCVRVCAFCMSVRLRLNLTTISTCTHATLTFGTLITPNAAQNIEYKYIIVTCGGWVLLRVEFAVSLVY